MRAAIVLAAGGSRRFGHRDKMAARLGAGTLLDHALARARAAGAQRIILVVRRPTHRKNVTVVRARDAGTGMSASLAAALAALRPVEREILIFLGDMPFAAAPRLKLAAGVDAVRPSFRGEPGHPMLVRAEAARKGLRRGDAGLATAITPSLVRGFRGNVLDIDTPAALRRARRYGSRLP